MDKYTHTQAIQSKGPTNCEAPIVLQLAGIANAQLCPCQHFFQPGQQAVMKGVPLACGVVLAESAVDSRHNKVCHFC